MDKSLLLRALTADLQDICPLDAGDKPDASPSEVAVTLLFRNLLRKLRGERTEKADSAALEKFLLANNRCRDWVLTLNSSWDEETFGNFREEIDRFFYPDGEPLFDDYDSFWELGNVGPGASLGAHGDDFYTKLFSSPLSVSSAWIYDSYLDFVKKRPLWVDAEITRLFHHAPYHVVRASSLSFVEKNVDTSRTICTEPTLNMWLQKGVGEVLAGRLKTLYGIDLSTQQQMNRDLARHGSLTGSLATLDLSSASDTISLALCRAVLPPFALGVFEDLRATHAKIKNQELELHMVSTMGNGFTFALQTVLFTCAIRAVARTRGESLPLKAGAQWGVNGDDIILPTTHVVHGIRFLETLGFSVNREKSFFEGSFRESCGGDYHNGIDVRPVFLKDLSTLESRFVAINRLNMWSAVHSVPLRRTIQLLRTHGADLAVPPFESDDAGIRTPDPIWSVGFLGRGVAARYQYVLRAAKPAKLLINAETERVTVPRLPQRRLKERVYNPSGLYISLLQGCLRNGEVTLRDPQGTKPRYETRRRVTPFWGPSATQLVTQGWDFWKRWNSVVTINLS